MAVVFVLRPLSQWSLLTVVKSQNLQGLFCGKESSWVFSGTVQGATFAFCSLCPPLFPFADLWNKKLGWVPTYVAPCASREGIARAAEAGVLHTLPSCVQLDGHFVGMLQVSRAFPFRREPGFNSVHPDGYSGLLSRASQSDAVTQQKVACHSYHCWHHLHHPSQCES